MDVLVSLVGLVVLSPVFLVVALSIKFESSGPVFFRQSRVGLYGRHFRIHKFRTMHFDAEAAGLQITVGLDPRITRTGAILRRYKLDELPQLLDVLMGSMSLVGPRPEVPKYVALYPNSVRATVLSVRPGITDNASIEFLDESALLGDVQDPEGEYVTRILPQKLETSVRYVQTHTLIGDLAIIARTLISIIRPRLRHLRTGNTRE